MRTIQDILGNRCPNCKKGQIYSNKNIYFNLAKNKMNKTCANCGYRFEKEPGYFFGSMYVSYALGVAQAIITAVVGLNFYHYSLPEIYPWIIIVQILMYSFNMRISRIIWIYLFRRN